MRIFKERDMRRKVRRCTAPTNDIRNCGLHENCTIPWMTGNGFLMDTIATATPITIVFLVSPPLKAVILRLCLNEGQGNPFSILKRIMIQISVHQSAP